MHLVIDGYGADIAILENPDAIYHFLDEYPDTIGMTKIAPPQVYSYAGQNPNDVGVSGFVLIAESHISVHTFPQRRYINIDVFSCKEFNAHLAEEELKTRFSMEKVRSWTLDRGLEYSDTTMAALAVSAERAHLLQQS